MTDSAKSERDDEPETGAGSGFAGTPGTPHCYRHPERESYIRCQRCDRYICPDCQRQAAVGFQCVECVQEAARSTPAPRTRFGGVVRQNDAGLVTKLLIALNLAVYLLVMFGGNALLQRVDLIGSVGFSGVAWQDGGVAEGAYWRMLTAAFVHVELWHLAVNMFALWVLGRPLEHVLGRLRFTGLYLVTALTGSAVAYALTPPNLPSVGASGAIFGLFGATIVLYRRLKLDMTWIIGLLALNVALNIFARGVLSWQAHLGGLLGGLALGIFLAYAPRENRNRFQLIGFVAVVVVTIAVVVGRTVQLTGAGY